VQLARRDRSGQSRCVVLTDLQRDAGISLAAFAQDLGRECVGRCRAGEADAQHTRVTRSERPHAHLQGLRLAQQAAAIDKQKLAAFGERDALGMTKKERRAQGFFQRADLLAERRLLHAQALGSFRDVPRLGHGHEVAQVFQVQNSISNSSAQGSLILFDPMTPSFYRLPQSGPACVAGIDQSWRQEVAIRSRQAHFRIRCGIDCRSFRLRNRTPCRAARCT
jgi:hypothetical protein